MQWVMRDAEADCVQLFGRLPQRLSPAIRFTLAGPATAVIVPAVAGRFVYIDKLVFSMANTMPFSIDDTGGNPIFASPANEGSALGGVEHIFERMLWTDVAGFGVRISTTAGLTMVGRVKFRYV